MWESKWLHLVKFPDKNITTDVKTTFKTHYLSDFSLLWNMRWRRPFVSKKTQVPKVILWKPVKKLFAVQGTLFISCIKSRLCWIFTRFLPEILPAHEVFSVIFRNFNFTGIFPFLNFPIRVDQFTQESIKTNWSEINPKCSQRFVKIFSNSGKELEKKSLFTDK